MTQDEAATHWQQRARAELKAARILFEKEDSDLYGEVLFHCHLALELALKSGYIKEKDTAAPFTHNLNELADLLRSTRTQQERNEFDEITEFAILSRYGDEEWYKNTATRHNAKEWIDKSELLLSKILQS